MHGTFQVRACRNIGRVALFGLVAMIVGGLGWSGLAVRLSAAGLPAGAAASPFGGCSVPSFGPYTAYPAGGNPVAARIGDFNHDGNPDVAVADYISDSVAVLLGTGSGAFGPPTTLPVGSAPSGLALGDFNLDGNTDIVSANYMSANISVLLGNGTGGFSAATNYPVETDTRSVAVGDFNHDGKPDL